MSMMIDASCPKCRRHIGWCGTFRNQPACSCGYRPPQADLDAAADRMEADRVRMATHPGKASADMRRQQRVDAGLTLRQAAKLLDVYPLHLSDTENCRAEPSAELCEKMATIYGIVEATS